MDLAQFGALAALIIGGFGLFAFMFTRLETRMDRQFDDFRQDLAALRAELVQSRRDMAEEFRAQRAEVAAQVSAIANAINTSRSAR
jgi:septal ring factor EnvC (AmiA/AmiB activator)